MGIYKYVDDTHTKIEEIQSLEIWIDKRGPTYLYYLFDPKEAGGEVRYVGIARDPLQRYDKHCNVVSCSNKATVHDQWVQWLYARHLEPRMVIYELLPTRRAAERAELAHIRTLREKGYQLVNVGKNMLIEDEQPA